ncbi:MAG: RNA polymerase Rpb4 family protein [archaeon YNP-LCB-024-027]|nr:RNA polymerase Rpb4 family protein [Candidatus Culexarchaeum yellowstonense]
MISIPRVISEKIEVPYAVVKDLLKKRMETGDLSTLQNLTLDVSSKIAKIDSQRAEDLIKKLVDEFKLSRFSAVQIANILPKTVEELRVLTLTEGRVLLTSELQRILEVIRSFC